MRECATRIHAHASTRIPSTTAKSSARQETSVGIRLRLSAMAIAAAFADERPWNERAILTFVGLLRDRVWSTTISTAKNWHCPRQSKVRTWSIGPASDQQSMAGPMHFAKTRHGRAPVVIQGVQAERLSRNPSRVFRRRASDRAKPEPPSPSFVGTTPPQTRPVHDLARNPIQACNEPRITVSWRCRSPDVLSATCVPSRAR